MPVPTLLNTLIVPRRAALAAGFALLALPVSAQIITVPLDPVDPNEVQPGEAQPLVLPGELPGPGAFFSGDGTTLGDEATLAPSEPLPPGSVVGEDVMTVEEDTVATGTGAVLKGLDMLAGTATDMTLKTGETAALGWLQVTLGECRYPTDNPSGDAYAWIVVREHSGEAPLFEGWMVASSPALNALDHARFDVWVSHCTTE